MPRKVARCPVVGLLAFLITFAALSIQFGLFAVPLKGHDFTDAPDGTNTRAHRESEEDRLRAARLVIGLAVLAAGSALGGALAHFAMRGRSTDRALAAAAGVCCFVGVAVWVASALACCVAAPNRERAEPVLIIERDWQR